jgi:type I restriction enzyme S subunit
MSDWKIHNFSEIVPKAISGEWGDDVGETKVLRTTNFQNDGTINYSNVVMRSISKQKIDQKALKFGDTIIEKSGGTPSQPVGRVVYFDKKDDVFLCNNFTSVLRPTSAVDSKYIFWFLFNNHLTGKTLSYQNKTTGIINLKLERYLQDLQIPLPAISIQNRIAEILDKADALRKKDQQLLSYYNDLDQSLYIDLFGDPEKNEKGWIKKDLGSVVSFPKGLIDPRIEPYSKMFHIGGDNIVSQTGELINYKPANILNLISGKYLFNETQILYNKIRPYLNKVAKPDFKGICSADMYPMAPNLKYINRDYLWAIMTSKDFINFSSTVARRANIPKINRVELCGYILPVPPIELQNKFSVQVRNIKQQKEIAKVQLQESSKLFQTLLQQAFNGGLN